MCAVGVIAPYVEWVSQAPPTAWCRKATSVEGSDCHACSQGPRAGIDVREYLATYNRGNLCIINIESVPALNSVLDDILAVPDIDALLIGLQRFRINLGIPEQTAILVSRKRCT